MKNTLFILLSILVSTWSFAQPTQTVRGTVVDNESQFPLIGVNVVLTMQDGKQKGVQPISKVISE